MLKQETLDERGLSGKFGLGLWHGYCSTEGNDWLEKLVGASAPSGGGPVSEFVVPSIDQALALAFASMPSSRVQRGVAKAAVGFAVLACSVCGANREQETIPKAGAEVGIWHGLASSFFWCRKQESTSASTAIALEVASIIVSEQGQYFLTLLFGSLFGEDALHLRDSIL